MWKLSLLGAKWELGVGRTGREHGVCGHRVFALGTCIPYLSKFLFPDISWHKHEQCSPRYQKMLNENQLSLVRVSQKTVLGLYVLKKSSEGRRVSKVTPVNHKAVQWQVSVCVTVTQSRMCQIRWSHQPSFFSFFFNVNLNLKNLGVHPNLMSRMGQSL